MKTQHGFTLVELVVVIVILGILAATAIPKFVDLSAEARNATALGVAASISSGSSVNYGAKKVGKAGSQTLNQANVCTSAILSPFVTGVTLVNGGSPLAGEFGIQGTGDCGAAGDGGAVTCTVIANGSGATAQDATVICVN